MKMLNNALLKAIFTLKGNLTPGITLNPKVFDGIEVAPFKNDAAASVSISADLEHNWAFRAWPADVRDKNSLNERTNVPNLLRLFEEYSVPITWATVGHLFLESCERNANGKAHADMPRPRVNGRFSGDWYVHDPCTNVRKDPLWYAPDLIQQITESKVRHEIGTHTFSHFDFRLKYSTKDLVQREIETCRRVMEPFGVQPKSLVFPHNETEYSYAKELFDLDVIALRHRDANVRLSYPERLNSGNYRIYESMNLRSTRWYDYVDKVKIFIDEAAKRRAAYHIFFHPSDPAELFENEFRRIIRYISEKREEGQVWVTTLNDLAAYCEARETVKIELSRSQNQLNVAITSTLNRAKFGDPEISLVIPIGIAPQRILEEKNGDFLERGPMRFKVDQQKQRLVVNVPASCKLVRLML